MNVFELTDAGEEAARQKLLRERARMLAQKPEQRKSEGELNLTVFSLNREKYGVESRSVVEVLGLGELTPVPGAPAFIAGIINLRGMILALLDIKKFFDLPESGISDLHQIVMVQGEGMQLGLLADTLVGIEAVPLADVQTSLPTLTGIRADYLKGITRDGLVILDMEKLLSDPRLIINQTADEHDN